MSDSLAYLRNKLPHYIVSSIQKIKRNSNKLTLYQGAKPKPLRLPVRYLNESLNSGSLLSISIVTPSYNHAQYIERTIRSVLTQNYPKLEYLIQDGASTDGTQELINAYVSEVTHIISGPDTGQANAINRGFSVTQGEIMAWLNSDDFLLPGTLRYVANFFALCPEVDVIYGHRILVDANDQMIGKWVLPPHDDEAITWEDYIPQETMFWRRRIWEKAGSYVDESYQFALDWELIFRFREQGAKFVRLPRFLGAFRVHAEQKTSSLLESIGKDEVNSLRSRYHGREISQREVNARFRSYQRKAWLAYWMERLKFWESTQELV